MPRGPTVIRYYVRPRGVARGGWEIRKVVKLPSGAESDGGLHSEESTRKQAIETAYRLNVDLRTYVPPQLAGRK